MVTFALRCRLHSQAKRCRERMQSHKESHLIAQKDKEMNNLPATSVHVRCRQRLACFEEHGRSVHLTIHVHNAVSKIWLMLWKLISTVCSPHYALVGLTYKDCLPVFVSSAVAGRAAITFIEELAVATRLAFFGKEISAS